MSVIGRSFSTIGIQMRKTSLWAVMMQIEHGLMWFPKLGNATSSVLIVTERNIVPYAKYERSVSKWSTESGLRPVAAEGSHRRFESDRADGVCPSGRRGLAQDQIRRTRREFESLYSNCMPSQGDRRPHWIATPVPRSRGGYRFESCRRREPTQTQVRHPVSKTAEPKRASRFDSECRRSTPSLSARFDTRRRGTRSSRRGLRTTIRVPGPDAC